MEKASSVNHYHWPDLGERIKHKTIEGIVTSRRMREMSFTVRDNFGQYFDIELEEFIVEEIRHGS